MTLKFKVWNNLAKEWFVPVYPDQKRNKDTKECFLSQGGDVYLHEKIMVDREDSEIKGAHISSIVYVPHFIPCLYTGCKDETGKKIYHNDVVITSVPIAWGRKAVSIGFIKINDGQIWLCSGDSNHPNAEDSTNKQELKLCKVVGNILETPDYFKLLKE